MEGIDTSSVEQFLTTYLPPSSPSQTNDVHVTATWAQSLDGRIAAAPGERTQLSGLYSKKMTHWLRTKHDAILVGKNTVIADNPRLNSRYSQNCHSPRPIILDSELNWDVTNWHRWAVLANAAARESKGPWVVVSTKIDEAKRQIIEETCHGEIICVASTRNWTEVLEALAKRGIHSLMVEGGAQILNSCLSRGQPTSVIVTIAPVFLGRHGVDVAPLTAYRLDQTNWWSEPSVADSVLAAKLV